MLPIPELKRQMLARRGVLFDAGHAEIVAIDRALERIASGDYGRCVACGQPIAPARLAVLPSAHACLACARARELPPS